MAMKTIIVDFISYRESVTEALDMAGAREALEKQKSVLIKPNLINTSPHPVTTSPDCCEAVVEYVRSCSRADIIVAEGCGEASYETDEVFRILGYDQMASRQGIELVDLNTAPLKRLKNRNCPVFPEMYLPEIVFTHYLISVPVLKAHSLATITGTMKNMMGLAPPAHYSGSYGVWKKSVFHGNMHQSIIDLNQYKTPDLSLVDASIGLAEYHLGGRECQPPVNKLIVGFDPVEVDREAARLLGFDWRGIGHLRR